MYNPFSLKGKTVLVTGASSGIGRAVAIECSKLGASVVITARNGERLNETLSLLEGNGHSMIVADLTVESDMINLAERLPVLDGCVNNAGVGVTLPLRFISMEELTRVYNVNCFSPIMLVKTLLKQKKLNKSASMVFTSSIAGYSNILPANAVYGSSKNALNAYVKYAALELSAKGIRCNSVNPGMINTPFINSTNKLITEDDMKKDLEKYPLKRYGEPEEVAKAICFLLSDASSYITGTNLVIDGGRSLI